MVLLDLFENDDDLVAQLNPRSQLIMKRIKARHPQAKSKLDALIADLHAGQRQDRDDITRLDTENDSDAERLDRVEQELELIKQRISQ